jgi:hypothetical protein
MWTKLKSIFTFLVIFWQKIWDNIYRFFNGVPTPKRSQITANLFLGSQYTPGRSAKAKDHWHECDRQYADIPTIANRNTRTSITCTCRRSIYPTPLEFLLKGVDFVAKAIKAGGKVYIHCRKGLGRGPTMNLAYLFSTGLPYDDGFALVA